MRNEAKHALEELEKEFFKEDKDVPRSREPSSFELDEYIAKKSRRLKNKTLMYKSRAIFGLKDTYRKIDPCIFDSVLRGVDETKIENAVKELVEVKESIFKLRKPSKGPKEPKKDVSQKKQKYSALLELNSDLLRRILERRDRLIRRNKWIEKIYNLIPQRLKELIIVSDEYKGVYREIKTSKERPTDDESFVEVDEPSESLLPKIEFKAILGLLKKKGYLKTTADGYFWTKKTVDVLGRKFLDEILGDIGREVISSHGYELSDDQRDYEFGDSYDSIVLESMLDAGARDPTFSSITGDDLRVWRTKKREKPKKSIVIATDVSVSMKGKKLWAAKKAALALFELEKRSEDTKLFLTAFSDNPYKLTPDELLNQEVISGTNISRVLKFTKSILADTEGEKYVFLISDCEPRGCDSIEGKIPENITKTLKKYEVSLDSNIIGNYVTYTFYQVSLHRKGILDTSVKYSYEKALRDSYDNAVKAAMMLNEGGIRLNIVNIFEDPKDLNIEFGKLLADIGRGNFLQTSPEDLGKVLVKEYVDATIEEI